MTPKYTAMQVMFLDDEFCSRFTQYAYADIIDKHLDNVHINLINGSYSDIKNQLKTYNTGLNCSPAHFEERNISVIIPYTAAITNDQREKLVLTSKNDKHEVTVEYKAELCVHIFPTVGDYLSILRKLNQRSPDHTVLFVGHYTGIGATRDQFVETFRRANIPVVFKADVV